MAGNTIIGLKNLRENMEKYITQVKSGKSFIVVKKSKPIFKLAPLDEWGDEGSWETVADFTKMRKEEVSLKKVLGYL